MNNNQFTPKNLNNFQKEFELLKAYYNFRNKFKNYLNRGQSNDNFIQNIFYLIDKKWLKNWEKYIGYTNIREALGKDNTDRDLNNNDYKWVEDIYKKTSSENVIYPLSNNDIFYQNVLNPLSDFFIIDKECLQWFNFLYNGNSDGNYLQNQRSFPIKFFKEKLLMLISNKMNLFIFKEDNLYFEILIVFIKETEGKKNIFEFLKTKNVSEYLKKEHNFCLDSDEETNIKIFGCELIIINRTIINKKQECYLKNNIVPKSNNTMNNYYLENKSDISVNLKNRLQQQTIISGNNNINQLKKSMNRVGLQNVGQSSYMNATIQCLNNISELTNKLLNLYNTQQINIEKHPLAYAFSNLLYDLNNTK